MAKVPLPDRGQPLDVTYMYQLATAINDVSDSISTATGKYATIDTRTIGRQTFKIQDIRIFAGYIEAANKTTVSPTTTIEKSVDFGVAFAYPPIVIATIINNNTKAAGDDATVVVSSTTTSSASFRVRFATTGEASVGINYIAIGVPA
jgi:hypothetical protein